MAGGRLQRAERRAAPFGLSQRRARRAPFPVHGQTAGPAAVAAAHHHPVRMRSKVRPQRPRRGRPPR